MGHLALLCCERFLSVSSTWLTLAICVISCALCCGATGPADHQSGICSAARAFLKDPGATSFAKGFLGKVYKFSHDDKQYAVKVPIALRGWRAGRLPNSDLFHTKQSSRHWTPYHSMCQSHLRHPNVAMAIANCDIDGSYAQVLPYINGTTLRRRVQDYGWRSNLTWPQRFTLAKDMASALQFLHTHPDGPFLHFDIHQDQFLVSESGDHAYLVP